MFNIYKDIADHLKEKLPVLKTIDADKGQLANPEKAYPMDFPAVLIDLDHVDWSNLGNKIQQGNSRIGITVAILPNAQSHQNSPNIDDFVDQMNIINQVYTALEGFMGLTRKSTDRQKRWDTIQSYTHIFTNKLTDKSARPVYTKNPVPPDLKMFTQNSVANF